MTTDKQQKARLDNVRSAYFQSALPPASAQVSSTNTDLQILAPPVSLDMLGKLLTSHTWTAFQEEKDGQTTAYHVETKEGAARC